MSKTTEDLINDLPENIQRSLRKSIEEDVKKLQNKKLIETYLDTIKEG